MHILEDRLKDFLSIVQGDKTGQLWDLVTCGNRQAGGQINCSVSFGQFQSGIASKLHMKSIQKSNIAQCVFDCSVVVSQDGLLYQQSILKDCIGFFIVLHMKFYVAQVTERRRYLQKVEVNLRPSPLHGVLLHVPRLLKAGEGCHRTLLLKVDAPNVVEHSSDLGMV